MYVEIAYRFKQEHRFTHETLEEALSSARGSENNGDAAVLKIYNTDTNECYEGKELHRLMWPEIYDGVSE